MCVRACVHARMRVVRVKQNASNKWVWLSVSVLFLFFTNLNIMHYTYHEHV